MRRRSPRISNTFCRFTARGQVTIKRRTALVTQVRGFLLEYGVVIRQGRQHLQLKLRELLADEDSAIPEKVRLMLLDHQAAFGSAGGFDRPK